MLVQWYAHLPGVDLRSSREWSFGAGKVVHIPFDEWSRLDPAFSMDAREYEQSQPCAGYLEHPFLNNETPEEHNQAL